MIAYIIGLYQIFHRKVFWLSTAKLRLHTITSIHASSTLGNSQSLKTLCFQSLTFFQQDFYILHVWIFSSGASGDFAKAAAIFLPLLPTKPQKASYFSNNFKNLLSFICSLVI